ncbi:hypothetical protein JCM8097_005263 [Rhodosporidiobolus ruineniae]
MARKRRRPSLFPLLPEGVLRQIFDDVKDEPDPSPLSTLLLCKSTLRPALASFYREAALCTSPQIAQFCAALAVRPELARQVRKIKIEDAERPDDADDGNWWHASLGAGDLLSFFVLDRNDYFYDPDVFQVGTGLVQDILLVCTNVRHVHLIGESLVVSVLTPTFFDFAPFPRLVNLHLELEDGEDYDHPDAKRLLPLVRQSIPTLQYLRIDANQEELPLDLCGSHPDVSLPPRSWELRGLNLVRFAYVGPELRNVFSAAATLRTLIIRSERVCRDFMADLVRLPPTLTELVLSIGGVCPDYYVERGTPRLDPTTLSSLFLPRLDTLELSGDIISARAFAAFSTSFPTLRRLRLGAHTEPTLPALLALLPPPPSQNPLDNSPRPAPATRLPHLECFSLSICNCYPSHTHYNPRYPVWPPYFKGNDAEALIAAADAVGLWMEGTVLCAAQCCGRNGNRGHECAGWYSRRKRPK